MNGVAPLADARARRRRNRASADTGDYTVDLKAHQVLLTEAGHENAEEILARQGMLAEGSSLYEPANILLIHHLYAACAPTALYHRDQQYVVQNGEVIIVDEFTGRLMAGATLVGRAAPGGRGQGRRGDPVTRTRRSPRSPSRTTSACTGNSPA
jgi:preprotein translocase subunit SecA